MKIIIADDHPLLRSAIAQALPGAFDAPVQIVEADSLRSLEQAITAHADIELVLLDLHMPGADGFSSLIYLRGERPALPVVMISSDDDPRTVQRARQFGAAGFIAKSSSLDLIRQALRTVMGGGEYFASTQAPPSEEDAQLAARLAQLTPQQFRVLLCLAQGLLNKQIGYELGLAENTVKVHVSAILAKLGCHSRTQAAVLVQALRSDTSGADTPQQ